MAEKTKIAQSPLILRSHRLMDAFAKSDDERDFYLDRMEGFILYVDLSKTQAELDALEKEISQNKERYCLLPKLTFYETKKIMEGFVNEKVYDIDTKEKLLDIIQSKEARENFLEYIYDQHAELEKWQQYYQERSRIRIIEWLRNNDYQFVFEEDLEMGKVLLEKVKAQFFEPRVAKDIVTARETLATKAKTYYSTEALNPRPKRGRPPKQTAKVEIEPQVTTDIYTTVSSILRPFLYIPDITSAAAVTFSSKFESEEDFLANLRPGLRSDNISKLDSLSQKLASLRQLARQAQTVEGGESLAKIDWSKDDDEEEEEEEISLKPIKKSAMPASPPPKKKFIPPPKAAPAKKPAAAKKTAPAKKSPPPKKPLFKKPLFGKKAKSKRK